MMALYGIMVIEWPCVICVDAAGVVAETTPKAASGYGLTVGSYVTGCSRVGTTQYGVGQEFFLMDAPLTMPLPRNLNLAQASTLGGGSLTACLGIFEGLQIPLLDATNLPSKKDEWIVILGGASNVGNYAIQLAIAAGYNVIASCSPSSNSTVTALGAKTFNYKSPLESQVAAITTATGTKVTTRIFDCVASDNPLIARELFKLSPVQTKLFTTTNDWTGISDFEGGKTYIIDQGVIGRPDPEAKEINRLLTGYIPVVVQLIEAGIIKNTPYEVVPTVGFEGIVEAYNKKSGGGVGGTKVVVKIQDE